MDRNFFSFILLTIIFSLVGCMSISTDTPSTSAPITTIEIPQDYPKQITLLVPLQGQLASSGQAIRDGFMMAYQNTPENMRPAKINVIDSGNSAQIQSTYNQAIQQGADFVVGPLAKAEVQTIAQSNNTSVPTLALNYLDTDQTNAPQLYQFGLSPLDEARQAAKLAREQGKQNAIIMTPVGSWGASVAQTFQSEWQKQGGTVVSTLALSNDQSQLIQQVKQTVLHQKGKFDVILLAAAPTIARQIPPLLKFYNAHNVGIYATSMIYAATPQSQLNVDLNGVIFCDAPWALNAGADADSRQKLATTYSDNFQTRSKLYGLGVDAYRLAMQFKSMTSSNQTLSGATGVLSFDGHRVVRQLSCAQFRNGTPVLL